MGTGEQHMFAPEGVLFLSTLMLPLVDTRTKLTLCTPSQRNVKGSVIKTVRSSALVMTLKMVVFSSPAIALKGEQP
jgi:hypothetical protein